MYSVCTVVFDKLHVCADLHKLTLDVAYEFVDNKYSMQLYTYCMHCRIRQITCMCEFAQYMKARNCMSQNSALCESVRKSQNSECYIYIIQ